MSFTQLKTIVDALITEHELFNQKKTKVGGTRLRHNLLVVKKIADVKKRNFTRDEGNT